MPNNLIHETSPYLLQHAHNPVNWEPWSMDAFERAKAENKLVIISIGYSACHWCHVMERESFEDEKVAQLMNDNYICIKVDREERPDVDQLFMDAAQLMVGRGGWPLNAFALPDGRPVYAGTYFPKIAWSGLLREISFGYKKQPDKYREYADKLINGIKGLSLVTAAPGDALFTTDDLDEAYFSIAGQIDRMHGGRGRAPKFPMPHNWLFLLRFYKSTKNEEALNFTLLTLDKMAERGIYDQIGGGFARYATDQEWKIPHFEKMLYDNVQLISLYSEAWLVSGKALYKKVVFETISFLKRELMSPQNGFYCALDADSEGIEGKFYVWKSEEIDEVIPPVNLHLVKKYFGIEKEALWEHGDNILLAAENIDSIAQRYGLSLQEGTHIIKDSAERLLEARNKRIRPGLDNKIILSWNALAIKGFLDAYKAFGEPEFLKLANETLAFIGQKMIIEGKLYHSFQNGTPKISGFLEDYCLYIDALISHYETTLFFPSLAEAKRLIDFVIVHFSDDESGFFWFTSVENNELAARKIELSDNVIPAPNSVMAHVLFKAGILFDNESYRQRADKMLQAMLPNIRENAAFYSNWASLLCYKAGPFFEVVFTGPKAAQNLLAFENHYIPNKIVAGAQTADSNELTLLQNRFIPGKSFIFVCENYSCNKPAEDVEEAILLIINR